MNKEVLNIMKYLDLNDITVQMILQCAPLISGLKISNLLSIQNENLDKLNEVLKDTDIDSYYLAAIKKRTAILLYKKENLETYLSEIKVNSFMKQRGYSNVSLNEVLPIIRFRYQEYRKDKKKFPHEIGVLLGYPIEDVEGFIQNEGKKYLYTGYWKVYENKQAKELLFRKFEEVKETMLQFIASGLCIKDIIEIFCNGQLQKY